MSAYGPMQKVPFPRPLQASGSSVRRGTHLPAIVHHLRDAMPRGLSTICHVRLRYECHTALPVCEWGAPRVGAGLAVTRQTADGGGDLVYLCSLCGAGAALVGHTHPAIRARLACAAQHGLALHRACDALRCVGDCVGLDTHFIRVPGAALVRHTHPTIRARLVDAARHRLALH